MLRADGFRLFRGVVDRKKLKKQADPADYVRRTLVRKGLVLAPDGVNPAMPYRHREIRKDVIEIEQMQHVTGKFAGGPPEEPDYVERFLMGEPWGGIVKSAVV